MADVRVTAKSGDEPKKKPAPARKPMPNMPGTTAFKGGMGEFLRDAWIEVTKKTTWPTRPELIRSTSVVLAAVVAISLYLAFWDFVGSSVTRLLFAH